MAFYYKKASDQRVVRAFTAKCADMPNGVTLNTSALVAGNIVAEGTPIGKGADGLYNVVKTAKVGATSTNSATKVHVEKGHHFKVGDYIYAVAGGACYAITAIATHATNSALDSLTIGTTLGVALSVGDVIAQGKASAGANTAEALVAPVALVGEAYEVNGLGSMMVNAVTIGQIKEKNAQPVTADIKSALKTIVYI